MEELLYALQWIGHIGGYIVLWYAIKAYWWGLCEIVTEIAAYFRRDISYVSWLAMLEYPILGTISLVIAYVLLNTCK